PAAAQRADLGTGPAAETLVEVRGLTAEYLTERGPVPACTDVSFTLRRGEILGVVGESACGKSTLLTALTRLQRPPAAATAGPIRYRPRDGAPVDLVGLDDRALARYRWREISVVMQSAMACLNPVKRLGAQFADVLRHHDRAMSRRRAAERTAELLSMVGIPAD